MRIKIKLIYLMLQKDVAIEISRKTNQYIQCIVKELERSFKTMLARTSLCVLEILFTSILTSTEVCLSIYFMLFIDILNAFVAL